MNCHKFVIILALLPCITLICCSLDTKYPKWKCDSFVEIDSFKICVLEEGNINSSKGQKESNMEGNYYIASDESSGANYSYEKLIQIATTYLLKRSDIFKSYSSIELNYFDEGRAYENRDVKFYKTHFVGGLKIKKQLGSGDSIIVVEYKFYQNNTILTKPINHVYSLPIISNNPERHPQK